MVVQANLMLVVDWAVLTGFEAGREMVNLSPRCAR